MIELGISFETIKSLLIFFAPVLLPRAVNLYRGLRVAYTHRPSPRPLPPSTSQALNVFFLAISFFLLLSLPFNPRAPSPNIFSLTRSRLNAPTDVIFNRLARFRPQQTLTAADTLLKSKFTSIGARKVYLRFGPDALTSCQFCSKDSLVTYLLYYILFNTLLPHLLHMFILGVTTSAPIVGREAAGWRNKFTIAGLILVVIDLYIVTTYDPVQSASSAVKAGWEPPSSLYYRITLLRPLAFAVFDSICASLIYLSATNRFSSLASPVSQADQVDQVASATLSSLTGASAKLHAMSVTRNAVVRDKALKDRDDVYWRTVVSMDKDSNSRAMMAPGNVWDEEEVVRAMSRAMSGQGGVDLASLGINAGEYVHGVTAGLENSDIEQ